MSTASYSTVVPSALRIPGTACRISARVVVANRMRILTGSRTGIGADVIQIRECRLGCLPESPSHDLGMNEARD